jgi:hypothetical protein
MSNVAGLAFRPGSTSVRRTTPSSSYAVLGVP